MPSIDPKTQALLWRALLGLVLVEVPVITYQLSQPTFDYRVLAVGLLGAAAGYLEKNVTFSLAPVAPIIVIPPDPAPELSKAYAATGLPRNRS